MDMDMDMDMGMDMWSGQDTEEGKKTGQTDGIGR